MCYALRRKKSRQAEEDKGVWAAILNEKVPTRRRHLSKS